ncbi:ester cyclase [Streptomyces sp. NPDC021098]|uniref:ester cyclase n=1 Tax=unclassified Streptomyces TaxID=2593676 RepID=UPI0037897E2C
MEHDRIEFILRAWRAAWEEGDTDTFAKILAPGYVRYTKTGSEDIDALRRTIEASRTAFPDLKVEILDTVEQADTLALRWRSHGTHTGSFMGVPPTGRAVTVTGASFCRFAGELLSEEQVVWDPRELLNAMNIWAVGSHA